MRKKAGANFLNGNQSFTSKNLDIKPRQTDFSRKPKQTKRPFKRLFFFTGAIVIAAGIGFSHQIFFSKNTVPALKELTRLPVIREIRQLVGANDNQLKGESRDRINVLITGQGGKGHPGPYLTDTIILASIKPSTGQLALLSIPRDMVVQIPGNGLEKINAANAYGETNGYPGGGAAMAARIMEDTLDLPINYYARIDFAGFEKMIDDMGGVKINIKRGFTDLQYPDNDLGYEVVSFEAGEQILNGDQALKYVRSRHAEGEAGDFARVKRQQNLLVALKDKILSPGSLLSPSKLTKLYKNLNQNIATNIQVWEIPMFIGLVRNADFSNITFKVLDDSPAGPLYATTLENGAYVLAPKIADYSEIQFIAKNLFTISDIKKEDAKLVIQNGTTEEGLALNTAAILEAFDLDVVKISNAPSTNFAKTVLYDLTGNTKLKSKNFLESTLQTKALTTLPMTEEELGMADFLIILGSDQVPSS